MRLSNQAIGTIMMCLQKAIISQTDVTDHLRNLKFEVNNNEALEVINPPTFEIPNEYLAQDDETKTTVGSD